MLRTGSCRCGQVRFALSGPPLVTMACHCTGCQRMTSSAFSLSVLAASSGFEVTEGEPVIGALHGDNRHLYCPYCMSWIFTRPHGAEAFVNVRATLFDDPGELAEPFMETMTSEKLSWVTTPAVESFEGFPGPQDFGRVMAAYAAARD